VQLDKSRARLQAVLEGNIGAGLAQIVAAGGATPCPSLAAAILAVSFIRHPRPQKLHAQAGGCVAAAGAYVAEQLPNGTEKRDFALDADTAYMVGSLTQLAGHVNPQALADQRIAEGMLQLWPRLLASGHLLAISTALMLMAAALHTSDAFRSSVLMSGAVGKVRCCCAARAGTLMKPCNTCLS
jgi:hypothetical protein